MKPRLHVAILLAVASAAMLAGAAARAGDEDKVLNIYNWSDYIADDTVKNFEKETGIRVHYDNFDSNEILHSKLVAGKTGYDIVVPSSSWARAQIQNNLYAPLDKSQLPNLKYVDPAISAQLARTLPTLMPTVVKPHSQSTTCALPGSMRASCAEIAGSTYFRFGSCDLSRGA